MEYILSVAIPTYNGEKTIGDLLESLISNANESLEIVVSDNASTDRTQKY